MVSQKSWQLEAILRLGMRLLAAFAVGLVLASIARKLFGDRLVEDSLLHLLLAVLAFQVAGLVCIAWFLREQQTGWAAAFGFRTDWRGAVGWGVAVGLAALPVVWGLQWLSATALQALGFDVGEQDAIRLLRESATLGKQVFIGMVAIGLAPPVEEMLFRGILYPFLKQRGFPRWGLWGTALMFALIHGSLPILLPLVVLAVVLALLYERTDNLLAPIIVHTIFNAANFAMLFILKAAQCPPHP